MPSSKNPELTPADRALIEIAQTLDAAGYRFTTITPASHAIVNARAENQWAKNAADVFGWSRPFQTGTLSEPLVGQMRVAEILADFDRGWRSTLRLSAFGQFLVWHSAFPTHAADAVFFGPDTYRFGDAIKCFLGTNSRPVRRAADIGCGAGPGVLLVASAFPGAAVYGVDINEEALRLTRVNAALAGQTNVRVCQSSLLDSLEGGFDLIVSNPPYLVDPGERAYRHGGGKLGADLSLRIVDAALDRLLPGGTLLLYTGVAMLRGQDPFLAAVRARLSGTPGVSWTYREADPDVFGEELAAGSYAKADRIAAVVLELTKDL